MKQREIKENTFLKGVADGIPICLGYLAVAFAFGIFAVAHGLHVWEATLISVANMTSAGQLAAVPMIASGSSLIELAASQLVINLRYALMGVSLSQKMDDSVRLRDRLLIAFVNTDEVFAVATTKQAVGRQYMFGLTATSYSGWVIGTFVGAIAGELLPTIIITALGIAIYGMFIAIILPAMRASKKVSFCVLLAVGMSCLFHYVPVLSAVPSGFVIIICAVTASAVAAGLFPVTKSEVTS